MRVNKLLTSLAQDPPMRKFPGMVGGLKAKQLMLSSGGEVTSTSYKARQKTIKKHEEDQWQNEDRVLNKPF